MQRKQRAPRQLLAALVLAIFLGVAAGCGYDTGTSSAGLSGAPTVQVTLTDFAIRSSITTFQMGTTYHFVVTNAGHTDHEWMIAPPMMSNMPMEHMHNMALMHIEMVHPGQTQNVDYRFHQMPMARQGSLQMARQLTGHYEAGMKLPITVQ